MSVQAASLSTRYVQAAAMWRSAQKYHQKLMDGISGEDLQKWEAEMSHAERMRKQDKSFMDIIGAKQAESHDAAQADDAGDAEASRGPHQWLRMAIKIEQKQ
jgi:hypothetical protein